MTAINDGSTRDLDAHQFWSAYRNVESYVHRGHYALARRQLVALWRNPRRAVYDPQRRIDYSYAVSLLQVPVDIDDIRAASLILESILRDCQAGVIDADEVLLRTELSSAMVLLGRFEQAVAAEGFGERQRAGDERG